MSTNNLFEYARSLTEQLQQLSPADFSNVKSLEIDCALLPIRGEEGDCREHAQMSTFFSELQKDQEKPVLYWFEIVSGHNAEMMHAIIPTLNKLIDRSVPAFRKNLVNVNSRILYVGKVKSKIVDRMVVHFGYGKNNQTQGLQLCHWANKEGLKLRLNYIPLPMFMAELAGLFELQLAKELMPVFGKHK